MKIIACEQYSPEWWAARRGVPTASEFGCIAKPNESFEIWLDEEQISSHRLKSAAEKALAKKNAKLPGHRLVCNFAADHGQISYITCLIGDLYDPEYPRIDRSLSDAMRRGTEMEPEARRYYELEAGADVAQVGFCLSDCGRFGCSPDALVGDEGVLELKNPMPHTQVQYLLEGALPDDYRAQVHGHLIVTGRAWCDFLSYSPGLPHFLIRTFQTDYTAALREALELFHKRYTETRARIEAMQ